MSVLFAGDSLDWTRVPEKRILIPNSLKNLKQFTMNCSYGPRNQLQMVINGVNHSTTGVMTDL